MVNLNINIPSNPAEIIYHAAPRVVNNISMKVTATKATKRYFCPGCYIIIIIIIIIINIFKVA